MKEQWKKIKDFSNYSVSTEGRVRDDKRGIIKKDRLDNHGYKCLDLYKDGKRTKKKVHRLVAEAFIPNPDNKPEVNHKDGCKCNACLNNLEWVTKSENMLHAYRTGLAHKSPKAGMQKGMKNPNGGKPRTKVRIVETGEEFKSVSECARAIDGNDTRIHDCFSGKQHTHRGYHFERID
jgi:hypothetical protein